MSEQQITPSPTLPNFRTELPFQRGYQAQSPGFSEGQLNLEDVLERVEHALRGEYWDYEAGVWVTANYKEKRTFKTPLRNKPGEFLETERWIPSEKANRVKPLLCDEGIHDLLRDLSSRMNKVIIMSNWTEKQVNFWLRTLAWDLNDKLFLNQENWNIRFEDLSTIKDIIMVPTDACMRRATLEGERRRIYEAVKTTEIRDIQQPQNKPGFLDWVPGLGKR